MKRFIIFFLVFPFTQIIGQNGILTVQTDASVSMHGFPFWKDLIIFSPETTIVASAFNPNPEYELLPGTYTVTAVSLFNHRLSKTVFIKSGEKNTFLFTGLKSFYKKDKSKKSVIESWKNNDSLYVIHKAAGWIKAEIDRLLFVKAPEGIQGFILHDDNTIKSKLLLTAEAAQEVVLLEKFIRNIKGKNQCSSVETYSVVYKKKVFSANDLSCGGGQLAKVYRIVDSAREEK
jgi:hypothetical protein